MCSLRCVKEHTDACYTKDVTPHQKQTLHGFYKASRELLASGAVPVIHVQRSFDEVAHGVRGSETWRPTHATRAALSELTVSGTTKVQRAHGAMPGRLDRYVRTVKLLSEAEMDFDDWWEFWCRHDATVLITREEHGSGKIFEEADVVAVPEGLFPSAGFAFKVRKKVEVAWAIKILTQNHS